jgi:hypothetical protein
VTDEQYMRDMTAPAEQRRADGSNIIDPEKFNISLLAIVVFPSLIFFCLRDGVAYLPIGSSRTGSSAALVVEGAFPAILFSVCLVSFTLHFGSIIADHFDRRNNEISYYDFQKKTLKISFAIYAIVIVLGLITENIGVR